MKFIAALAGVAASVAAVTAQSSNTSLCDKYTTALLMNNTAANQLTVLTLVVNTALIGNYSNATGPAKNAVSGILNPNGTVNGTAVNLVPYFSGALKSTNRNGQAVAMNFLDGGGAAPLKMNKPAWDNATSSNQYILITHLYEIFGSLLGCSMQTASGPFKTYQGNPSMSEVHRFMDLNRTEMNYFIQEVGKAATSFGVSTEDATAVGTALNTAFNFRCSPPSSLGTNLPNASQSVCLDGDCPLAMSSNCTQSSISYPNGTNGVEPAMASGTSSSGGSGSGTSGSGSGSGTSGSGSSGSTGGSSGTNDSPSNMIVNAVGALALAAAGAVAVCL